MRAHFAAHIQIKTFPFRRAEIGPSPDKCMRDYGLQSARRWPDCNVEKIISSGLRMHLAHTCPVGEQMKASPKKESPRIQARVDCTSGNHHEEKHNPLLRASQSSALGLCTLCGWISLL